MINVFRKVNIETLNVKIYISLLHINLNKLQNQIILRSCKIIYSYLIKINQLIERVGRTVQHMVESLKVIEEKLWTDLAIYCHVC